MGRQGVVDARDLTGPGPELNVPSDSLLRPPVGNSLMVRRTLLPVQRGPARCALRGSGQASVFPDPSGPVPEVTPEGTLPPPSYRVRRRLPGRGAVRSSTSSQRATDHGPCPAPLQPNHTLKLSPSPQCRDRSTQDPFDRWGPLIDRDPPRQDPDFLQFCNCLRLLFVRIAYLTVRVWPWR